jgi:meiosis-specific protein
MRKGHRNLGLNLFYTDDTPASYEPHGFTNCVHGNLHFPGDPTLTRVSKKTSGLVAGAHQIGVVVSHVDSVADGEEVLHIIPETLTYSVKRSRLDEYSSPSRAATVDSTHSPSQHLPIFSQPLPANNIMASPAAPSTQIRRDMQTKEALQRMQRSSPRPKELIPTQSLVNADDVDAEDSVPPNQSYSHAIANSTQTIGRRDRMIVPAKMAELLVHVKAAQDRGLVDDGTFDQGDLNKYKITRNKQPGDIKCECGDYGLGGLMVCHFPAARSRGFRWPQQLFCEICGTWQHQSCYGWDVAKAKTCPIDHACYSCLLLPEEKDLNDWMPTLVACRNALKYLYEHGFPEEDDYSGLMEAMRKLLHLLCQSRAIN